MTGVIAALAPHQQGWMVQQLSDAGEPLTAPQPVDARGIADLEDGETPRWLFSATDQLYPALHRAGVRVARCHDVSLTERILLGRETRFGEPVSAAAVHARVNGLPVPEDPATTTAEIHPTLFDPRADDAPTIDPMEALRTAIVDQLHRIGNDNALKLLVAAESASALAAVEMGVVGLPWRADVHDSLLTEALGPRPSSGARPEKLEQLAAKIDEAFGHPVNPDSAVDLREAFRRAGFALETTRAWVIRELDHPAVPHVLAYKELHRLHTANGWNWLAEWVSDGRFHAEYFPGGVVSGRWATRGGGALQIPRSVRSAVVPDPGYQLVVADAAQLEPRVLAAVSNDPALAAVSAAGDLYDALAADGFGGDRAHAKVAMLGAMYGQTSGEAGRLLGVLRTRYPVAMNCVESAARQGERGESVRSVLGRASPLPGPAWQEAFLAGNLPEATDAEQRRGQQVARDWGRFTRNFVIQASAADWASVWLSLLRQSLRAVDGAELVFFQHDELVIHVPAPGAGTVCELAVTAAKTARDLVFPGSTVQTPVRPVVVDRYSDAK